MLKSAEISALGFIWKTNKFEPCQNFSFQGFQLVEIQFSYLHKINGTNVFVSFRLSWITLKFIKKISFGPFCLSNKIFFDIFKFAVNFYKITVEP
jgi:hypothetical protein